MTIPVWDYRAEYDAERDDVLDAVDQVLRSGRLILGDSVAAFEAEFAAYCGVPHAAGVNSGTDALILALRTLDLQPGDEVLEIGTGSGFAAACMGRLARTVTTLERHGDLAEAARSRLAARGLEANIDVVVADALSWDAGGRRFDAVCVTGAVATLPPRFLEWLRPGGRLFVVRGIAPAMEAVLLRPADDGPQAESLFETELPYLAGAGPVPRFEL